MAKQGGLGDNFYWGGVDLSGDVGAIGRVGGGLTGTQDVTGINKFAFERRGLLRDGGMEWTSFLNPAAAAAHPTLSTRPTTDEHATYFRGTTLGNPAASLVAKQINYDPTRGADGSLTIAVQALANGYGLEWGVQLTAGKRSDTTATNGTSVDFAAAGTHGLQAWLHVFSFTGTSCTVKLQSSSDNGSTDAFADVTGGGFTAATGVTSERITVSGNVERYLRAVTTGTFTECTFAVQVTVNATAVVF
ncbi:hypothetical protein GCM10022254_09970 [Actinomadura meridiana]|uniref:Uncharacterized protein n=1 Tax=Actinomadura meridiana TaxID=559626 RepID=A0ABP8BTW9_9ACTN